MSALPYAPTSERSRATVSSSSFFRPALLDVPVASATAALPASSAFASPRFQAAVKRFTDFAMRTAARHR